MKSGPNLEWRVESGPNLEWRVESGEGERERESGPNPTQFNSKLRRFVYRVRLEGLQSLLLCENHCAPVICVAFAPEASDKFATASVDNTLRIWDSGDYTVITTAIVKDAGAPTCLVYSLDMLVSGWDDGIIRAHDVDSGNPLWLIENAHR